MMKELILSILILTGCLFILIAALGLFRLGDLYSRMHATTKATSFGILLLMAGVVLFFSAWIVLLKAVLIIFFIYLTAPLAAHSIASSFHRDRKEG
jgi:multicomponent Na+:H+ antiporter subunit G